jgi:Uracil DNA glycosylase superfamily
MSSSPVEALSAFYRSQRIGVDEFQCKCRDECERAAAAELSKQLHRGSEAYVGSLYGEPFPIAVVSLSEADGSSRLSDREPLEAYFCKPESLNAHMRGTLEMLERVLEPGIAGREVLRHFALTRAAKCALKESKDKPPFKCFWNCREFVLPELDALNPQLVISQGTDARLGLESNAQPLPDQVTEALIDLTGVSADPARRVFRGVMAEHFRILRLTRARALWLSLVHPSDRGGRWARTQRLQLPGLLGWITRGLIRDFLPRMQG